MKPSYRRGWIAPLLPTNRAQWGRGRRRARNRGACKVTRPVGCGARDRASPAISRALSKAGYPDTCCVEVYARWLRMLSSGRGKKSASRLVAGPGGPRGDRKRHGASERGADYRHSPDASPSSPSSRFCVFAKASARKWGGMQGEDDYACLFNTKGSKTNTEVRRSVRRAL